MIRIKNAIRIFEKSNLQASDYSNEGIYPFYTSSQNLTKKCDVALFPEDSITMGTGGQASVNYSDASFSTSTDCFNFQSIFGKDYTKFIYYYLLAHIDEINSLGFQGMGLKHLQKDFIYNLEFDENLISKEKISYLDCLSQCINALITNEEKQIEKLKAYKQVLISEVVTKGLDPNVPMKDSGVEWIGKIPANWSVAILKSFFKEHKNKNKNMRERNLLSLSYGNIVRKDINSNDGLLPWSFEGYNIVEPGFIVLRLTDLQNDKKSLRTGLVNERGIITSAYVSLSPRTNVNSYYYQKLLHSYDLKKVFYNMGSGVRQSLSYEEVSKIPVLVPPISEQDKICSFIQNELGKYDIFITKKQSLIDLLKQYRQSVIYEYVTGKRKVY